MHDVRIHRLIYLRPATEAEIADPETRRGNCDLVQSDFRHPFIYQGNWWVWR